MPASARILPRKSRGKMYFHIITSAFYLPQQKMLKFEGCYCKSWWCDDVSTWLGGTPGHIEGGSRFPFTFISSKCDGQCNAETTESFLSLNFLFLFHFSISQKNSLFYMHNRHVSFPCLMSNKYLINLFDSLDWNLDVKSAYIFLSMLWFWRLILSFFLPSETFKQFYTHTEEASKRYSA